MDHYSSDGEDGGSRENRTLVETEYDQEVTSPSTAVIEGIAAVEDVDPVGLSTPSGITLHDYVETDALDRLLSSTHANDVSITFLVNEYRVWIGRTVVAIAARATDSASSAETDP